MVYNCLKLDSSSDTMGQREFKKRKKIETLCMVCNQNVGYDQSEYESDRLFAGKEQDCFKLLLKMLQISAQPFFLLSKYWRENEFTFCTVCGGFIKRGLLLIEELKMLNAQLESVRTAVVGLLHVEADPQAGIQCEDSMKARIMLKQCYKPCKVSVDSDARLKADKVKNVTFENAVAEDGPFFQISNVRSESGQLRELQLVSGLELEDAEEYDRFPEYYDSPDPEEETLSYDAPPKKKRMAQSESPRLPPQPSPTGTSTRRSLRPRKEKLPTRPKIFKTTECIDIVVKQEFGVSHNCSVCSESFNTPRELAKHYWGQHGKGSAKLKNLREDEYIDMDEYNPESAEESDKSDSDWEASPSRTKGVLRKSSTKTTKSRSSLGSPAIEKVKPLPALQEKLKKITKKKSPYRVWSDPDVLCLTQLECPFCQQTYPAHRFSEHIKEVHGLAHSVDVYACENCGDVYDDEASHTSDFQKKHTDCEITEDALTCKICTVTLESMELKLHHHRYNHPHSRMCNVCKVTFVTYSSVLRHQNKTYELLRSGVKSIEKTNDSPENNCKGAATALGKQCEFCGEFRQSINSYASHLRSHGFDYQMSCVICTKCGKIENRHERSNFKDFFDTHSTCEPVDTAFVKCYECGRLTRDLKSTIAHYNHCHGQEGEVECELCHGSYTSLLRLRSHEIAFHNLGLVIYQKTTQSSSVQTNTVSKEHLKLYHCSACQQCFRLERYLVKHLKAHNFDDLGADGKELIEKYTKNSILRHVSWNPLKRKTTLAAKARSQKLKSRNKGTRSRIPLSSDDEMIDSDSQNSTGQLDGDGRSEIPGQCPFCEEMFDNEESPEYEKHILEVHKLTYFIGLYGCRNCGEIYRKTKDTPLSLFGQFHLTCEPSDSAPTHCPACTWKGKNFLHKMRHFKSSHYYPGLKCNICGKEFRRIAWINQHKKEAHDIPLPSERQRRLQLMSKDNYVVENYPLTPNFVGDNNDRECAICKETFTAVTRVHLSDHVATSHNISYSDSIYGCARCYELYNGDTDCSIADFAEKHASCPPATDGLTLIKCKGCDTSVATFQDLVIHNKKEHATKDIWCFLCGKKQGSLKNLRIHHVKVHEIKTVGSEDSTAMTHETSETSKPLFIGPTPDKVDFVCGICDVTFSYDDCKSYKGHMRTVHNLRSIFGIHVCRTCGDVFQEREGFTMKDFGASHYKCHRPERGEFKCKDCGKIFKDLAARCRHFLRDHYKITADYNCRLCGSPFKFYSLLRMHMWNAHRERLPDIKERIYRRNPQTQNPEPEATPSGSKRVSGIKLGPLKHTAPPEIITCKFCPQSYKIFQFRLLKDHVDEVHGLSYTFNEGNDVFGCDKCGIICIDTDKDIVDEFAKNHNAQCTPAEDPLFICPVCKRSEKSYKELDRHYRVFHTHRAFDCPFCDKTFHHKYMVVNHVRSAHKEEGAIPGSINSQDPSPLPSLAVVTMERGLPTKCALCPAELSDKVRGLHYATEHCLVLANGYYGCYNCHDIYSVSTHQSLPEYVEVHKNCPPPDSRERFKCKMCSKEFKNFSVLTGHHARIHLKVKYCCDECGKMFKSEKCFRDHKIMHKNPFLYKCPDCPKTFRSFRNLKLHMDSKNKDLSVVCEVCGGKFMNELTLTRHLKTHTERVRNIKCDLCDKMFWNRQNMSSHIREFHRKARKDRWKKAKEKRNQKLEEEARGAHPAPTPAMNCDELLQFFDA